MLTLTFEEVNIKLSPFIFASHSCFVAQRSFCQGAVHSKNRVLKHLRLF